MATETKKPKWGVVTFKQIESRRKELGISKTAMATGLGITNSTFHNWQRGTTVPHPAQQDVLKAALDKMTGTSTDAKAAPKASRKATSSNGTGRKHPERKAPARENVAGGSMQGGFSATHPFFLGSGQSVPGEVQGIATITAAFITSQSAKEPPTKDSIYEFISGLKKALAPEAAPAPATDTPAPATA